MAISDIPLFGMLRERMGWLEARQSVLSQNVANADTPGYAARDVKELRFSRMVEGATSGRLHLATTREGHLAGSPSASSVRNFRDAVSPDSETSPTGNSVVLEEQMMKVSETQMDYQTATSLYAKGLGLIRLASTGRA